MRTTSAAQSKRVNRGRIAEDAVERVHNDPAFQAFARLWRSYPGKVGQRFVAPQGPDFQGFLVGTARHCFVEVKAVEGGGLSLPQPGKLRKNGEPNCGDFTQAEAARLSACYQSGGLAVVLVLYGPHGPSQARWCAVPWGRIDYAISQNQTQLTGNNLLEFAAIHPVWYLKDAWDSDYRTWSRKHVLGQRAR